MLAMRGASVSLGSQVTVFGHLPIATTESAWSDA
jgi:hypothetical protein